jgi:hypothetical protein
VSWHRFEGGTWESRACGERSRIGCEGVSCCHRGSETWSWTWDWDWNGTKRDCRDGRVEGSFEGVVEEQVSDAEWQGDIFVAGYGGDFSLFLLDAHEAVVAFLDDLLRDSGHAVDGDFEGITTRLGIRHPTQ